MRQNQQKTDLKKPRICPVRCQSFQNCTPNMTYLINTEDFISIFWFIVPSLFPPFLFLLFFSSFLFHFDPLSYLFLTFSGHKNLTQSNTQFDNVFYSFYWNNIRSDIKKQKLSKRNGHINCKVIRGRNNLSNINVLKVSSLRKLYKNLE